MFSYPPQIAGISNMKPSGPCNCTLCFGVNERIHSGRWRYWENSSRAASAVGPDAFVLWWVPFTASLCQTITRYASRSFICLTLVVVNVVLANTLRPATEQNSALRINHKVRLDLVGVDDRHIVSFVLLRTIAWHGWIIYPLNPVSTLYPLFITIDLARLIALDYAFSKALYSPFERVYLKPRLTPWK